MQLRFYRSLGYHFLWRRRALPVPPELFSPMVMQSHAPPYECDLNLHKSNSTYFSDLDISRTHLMGHLTKEAFARRRRNRQPVLYLALAGVCALFRREIKPLHRYAVSSRVLAWDAKWIFIVSHFVSPDEPRAGQERTVYACSLSKCVFKSGRITVPPESIFSDSGLLPPKPAGAETPSVHDSGISTPSGIPELGAGEATRRRVEKAVMEDAVRALDRRNWEGASWEVIDAERRRGLELAKMMMGLDGLYNEHREGTEEGLVKMENPF